MISRFQTDCGHQRWLGYSAIVIVVAVVLVITVIAPARAGNAHYSTIHTTSADGGLSVCKWRGYHEWSSTFNDMNASTWPTAGDCAEVHVRLRRNGVTTQDYSTYYAETWQTSGTGFQYSDHNVDPLGAEGWIGFRMT